LCTKITGIVARSRSAARGQDVQTLPGSLGFDALICPGAFNGVFGFIFGEDTSVNQDSKSDLHFFPELEICSAVGAAYRTRRPSRNDRTARMATPVVLPPRRPARMIFRLAFEARNAS
jgi:hypothetical protein